MVLLCYYHSSHVHRRNLLLWKWRQCWKHAPSWMKAPFRGWATSLLEWCEASFNACIALITLPRIAFPTLQFWIFLIVLDLPRRTEIKSRRTTTKNIRGGKSMSYWMVKERQTKLPSIYWTSCQRRRVMHTRDPFAISKEITGNEPWLNQTEELEFLGYCLRPHLQW